MAPEFSQFPSEPGVGGAKVQDNSREARQGCPEASTQHAGGVALQNPSPSLTQGPGAFNWLPGAK